MEVEIDSQRKTLCNSRYQGKIFPKGVPAPLIFLLRILPLTLIVRKANAGHLFKTCQEVNNLIFTDDLKIYSRDEFLVNFLVSILFALKKVWSVCLEER